MCEICAQTTPFKEDCDYVPVQAVFATVIEGADAPDSTATPYSIEVTDVFTGTLDTAGDRDWVEITLEPGIYEIDLYGTGGDALVDPLLRVYDEDGNLIGQNDDGGAGRNSSMFLEVEETTTYYLAAGSWRDRFTGDYALEVNVAEPATYDELADYLVNGYWEDNGAAGRSFDTSTSNVITVNLTGLTAEGQQLARWALEAWEMVADLDFQEVTTGGQIVFDDEDSGAYSTSVVSGDTITSSFVNVDTAWIATYGTTIDSYSFQTYVHEIGHALGLGHQGGYNGSATYGSDNTFLNDSWQVSIMSYFSQTDNTTTDADFAWLSSTMMADIIAIQSIYGAAGAGSETDGDTTYGVGNTLGNYFGDLMAAATGEATNPDVYDGDAVAMTIYDYGGTDTIDVSFYNGSQSLDLNDEAFSDVGGTAGSLGIARGTIIENGVTGDGNDLITGNEADNVLTSNGGNDTLNGGAGMDTLEGGAGFDRLNGEADDDLLVGGAGLDIMTGGSGADSFVFDTDETRLSGLVTDFTDGEDLIVVSDATLSFGDVNVLGNDSRAILVYDGQFMVLNGIGAGDIGADDFVFGLA